MIRDHIVVAIQDRKLSEKLQLSRSRKPSQQFARLKLLRNNNQ